MESSLCLQCLQIFNQNLRSPLGKSIMSYFVSRSFPDEINFLNIKTMLENNNYQSPSDWLDSMNEFCQKIISFYGADSEITLAVLTFEQNVQKMAQPLMGGSMSEWKSNVSDFLLKLDKFVERAPNDLDEYMKFTEEKEPLDEEKEQLTDDKLKETNVNVDENKNMNEKEKKAVDINELKEMIQRIDNDKDMQNIAKIVSHYESEFRKVSGMIDCDLRKLNENTQKMLYDYVSKRVPPIKITSDTIPRMKSTPLPQSLLTETITSALNLDTPKLINVPNSFNLSETSPFLKINTPKPTITNEDIETENNDTQAKDDKIQQKEENN